MGRGSGSGLGFEVGIWFRDYSRVSKSGSGLGPWVEVGFWNRDQVSELGSRSRLGFKVELGFGTDVGAAGFWDGGRGLVLGQGVRVEFGF